MYLHVQSNKGRDLHGNKYHSFYQQLSLVVALRSYIHQTLLKILLALHTLVTYNHCHRTMKRKPIKSCTLFKEKKKRKEKKKSKMALWALTKHIILEVTQDEK